MTITLESLHARIARLEAMAERKVYHAGPLSDEDMRKLIYAKMNPMDMQPYAWAYSAQSLGAKPVEFGEAEPRNDYEAHAKLDTANAEIARLSTELAAERERRETAESARAIHFQMRKHANARVAELEGLLRLTLPHIKYHKSHCAGPDLRGDCDCGVDLLHERIGAALAAGKETKCS